MHAFTRLGVGGGGVLLGVSPPRPAASQARVRFGSGEGGKMKMPEEEELQTGH